MMEDEAELAVGLSVTCSTTIDECYVVDVEKTEDEACASTSELSFGMVPFMTKSESPSASPVALVCPGLSYEIPLIVNQRSGTRRDKNQNEDIIVDSEGIDIAAPLITSDSGRQKYNKQKQKMQLKQKPSTNMSYSSSRELDPEVSDYSTKNRKAFFCRACGKAFKFQTSLLRHNNKVHISKYQCPTCSRLFSRQAYLDVHTSKLGSTCFLGNYTSNNKTHNRAATAE